jgi:hypothetical protein
MIATGAWLRPAETSASAVAVPAQSSLTQRRLARSAKGQEASVTVPDDELA